MFERKKKLLVIKLKVGGRKLWLNDKGHRGAKLFLLLFRERCSGRVIQDIAGDDQLLDF